MGRRDRENDPEICDEFKLIQVKKQDTLPLDNIYIHIYNQFYSNLFGKPAFLNHISLEEPV